MVNYLASEKNSDPRLIVDLVKNRWGYKGVRAALKCDETQKNAALTFITDPTRKLGLEGLFNMLKGSGSVATIALEEGVYYNCAYLVFKGAKAAGGTYTGLHNMLVTMQNGVTWFYNSNEVTPKWGKPTNWKEVENQNLTPPQSAASYVFTGVAVEIRK